MSEKNRYKKIEFWVSKSQFEKINENMEQAGLTNLSEFLRLLGMSPATIHVSIQAPKVLEVSEANLVTEAEEVRTEKRALG